MLLELISFGIGEFGEVEVNGDAGLTSRTRGWAGHDMNSDMWVESGS